MRPCITIFAVALFAGHASAAPTILHCGRLLDVTTLQMQSQRSIVVEGNKIIRVEAGYVDAAGSKVVDLKAMTCLPGLIDLHVHLSSALNANSSIENFTFNPADYAIRSVANAETGSSPRRCRT